MWANTLPFAPALFSNSDNSTEVRKSVFIDKRCCRLLATLSGFTFVNAPPADPPFVSFSSSKACCPCKLHTCSLFSLTAADYPSRATSPHDHRADHDAGEETLQLHQLGRYTTGGSAAFWIVHSLANATTRARNYVLSYDGGSQSRRKVAWPFASSCSRLSNQAHNRGGELGITQSDV